MRTRIKVGCMASLEEAQLAIRAGADAVGVVGVKPASPRTIDDRTIAAIAVRVPPPVATFLLTSERTAEGVARHVLATGATTVQIVSNLSPSEGDQESAPVRGGSVLRCAHGGASRSR
jgi:phosphoribosylanthranilate isomerase